MKKIIDLLFFLGSVRFLPHVLFFYLHPKYPFLLKERNIWIKIVKNEDKYTFKNFIWLLSVLPEYRSVLYYRIGRVSHLLNFFAKGRKPLQFDTSSEKIGLGLVLQHGFSTIINAEKIGVNCQIWHNVTIGTNKSQSGNIPAIGNNVKICAGAIVLGNIKIGNNVTIGAGCVVVKSVPENAIVVGNPAHIIKINEENVFIKL
jgi:serine O-acetyltransferase